MDGKRFGKQNQKRNNQSAAGRNNFKIKRKSTNDFNSFKNNQKRRKNMPNVVLKKDQNSGKKGLAQKRTELKRFQASIGGKKNASRNSQLSRQRFLNRPQQKSNNSKKTQGVSNNGSLKLFTKTFDARRRIESKRKHGDKGGTTALKADSKAILAEAREQMRDATLAKKRAMSVIGDQIKIISKVQAEDERRASFTGTSLKVTTLQTNADRLKHRETLQSGSSLLITAKKGEDDTAEEVSEYSRFEARRKAALSSKPAAENDRPKLSSLNPISRPTNFQPAYHMEEETSHHMSNSSKISISNLHPNVTHDDIYELFSAVGPLKNARLTRPGVAEIIYRTPEHAAAAYKKYHGRNLDGQPMICKITPSEQTIYSPPTSRPPRGSPVLPPKSPSTKPVVFTVKI
ncbi:uncharacterized protein LOC135692253 [Rhopilema esculentum]|uniref:uncharacterized protein LOC135692253 n=1 Tax=Rhopilema esculentum TaxID=499914 RepID=UPI0031D50F39